MASESHIGVKVPVVQVVDAVRSVLGEIAHLVVLVAVLLQVFPQRVQTVRLLVLARHPDLSFSHPALQGGTRLKGQAVKGKMVGVAQ